MSIEEILCEVEVINEILKMSLWMDFEIKRYSEGKLTIYGGVDLLYSHSIEISFEDVFFVSLPFEWKTDTKAEVLHLLEGEASKAINLKFMVEQGYHIFKFMAEDYPGDFGCFIGARMISHTVIAVD